VAVAGGLRFATVAAAMTGTFSDGPDHSCGRTTDGVAYCWGGFGRHTTNSSTPVLVPGDQRFSAVSAAGFFSCGATTRGDAFCWGGRSDNMQPARVQ
jgi:hypothetical protein